MRESKIAKEKQGVQFVEAEMHKTTRHSCLCSGRLRSTWHRLMAYPRQRILRPEDRRKPAVDKTYLSLSADIFEIRYLNNTEVAQKWLAFSRPNTPETAAVGKRFAHQKRTPEKTIFSLNRLVFESNTPESKAVERRFSALETGYG